MVKPHHRTLIDAPIRGQGVANMDITVRTGSVVNVIPVHDDDHVLLLTDKGQLLRFQYLISAFLDAKQRVKRTVCKKKN